MTNTSDKHILALHCQHSLRALPAADMLVLSPPLPFGVPLCRQVRAMQIIDELEVNKRGPYGGGLGVVGFSGERGGTGCSLPMM